MHIRLTTDTDGCEVYLTDKSGEVLLEVQGIGKFKPDDYLNDVFDFGHGYQKVTAGSIVYRWVMLSASTKVEIAAAQSFLSTNADGPQIPDNFADLSCAEKYRLIQAQELIDDFYRQSLAKQ